MFMTLKCIFHSSYGYNLNIFLCAVLYVCETCTRALENVIFTFFLFFVKSAILMQCQEVENLAMDVESRTVGPRQHLCSHGECEHSVCCSHEALQLWICHVP